MSDQIKLGNKVKDVITGIEGIAVSKIEYLNGVQEYGIQLPAKKDEGVKPAVQWIDQHQVKKVGDGILVKLHDPQLGFRQPE